MTVNQQIYVYCVIPNAQPLELGSTFIGDQTSRVYTVSCEEIAAVVCDVEGEVLPTRTNLLAHQQVLARVMETCTIIPFSFGQLFCTEENVLMMLKRLYQDFQEGLRKLENKIEVGLKLIAKKEWLSNELEKQPHLASLQAKMTSQGEDGSFYDQIALGEAVYQFVTLHQQRFVEQVYLPLSQIAVSAKLNQPNHEQMLLNSAFLIENVHESTFDERVNELYDMYSEQVEFNYTGPWPAYNFIEIRVKARGSDDT